MCLTEFNQEIYTESVKEEGRAEGRAEGLEALVVTLKQIFTENEDIFRMVTQNKAYRDLSREEVFKYL